MPTKFTELRVKDIQVLQGYKTYEAARRALVAVRDACNVRSVLVYHFCQYHNLPESEVLRGIK